MTAVAESRQTSTGLVAARCTSRPDGHEESHHPADDTSHCAKRGRPANGGFLEQRTCGPRPKLSHVLAEHPPLGNHRSRPRSRPGHRLVAVDRPALPPGIDHPVALKRRLKRPLPGWLGDTTPAPVHGERRAPSSEKQKACSNHLWKAGMKTIAFFNNKGGVGKTTLLCNLAGYLALELESSVLVIDADPQCNATQSMFGDETLVKLYERKSFTIDSVVRPLSLGKGFTSDFEPRRSRSFGVDVLPGDPRLALTEDLLATDWGQATSGSVRGLRTTLLFRHLLEFAANYDYVFFDVGPSLGAINRSVLLAADYFLTPMSTDIFSLKALENISLSLQKWKKQYVGAVEQVDDIADVGVDDIDWRLRFIGYVTQQYTAKRDSEGQPRAVRAFDHIMKKVPNVVLKELVTPLQPDYSKVDYVLGTIPTLHSLIPLSQTSRRPIFALRASDGVVGAHFAKVADYKKTIGGIAGRLIENVEGLA